MVSKLIKSGVKNFSFQTLNEPRFCENGRPQVNQWQRLERRIIDSVRTLSPELYIISSAVCTAADQPLSQEKRYTSLNTYLPNKLSYCEISKESCNVVRAEYLKILFTLCIDFNKSLFCLYGFHGKCIR